MFLQLLAMFSLISCLSIYIIKKRVLEESWDGREVGGRGVVLLTLGNVM